MSPTNMANYLTQYKMAELVPPYLLIKYYQEDLIILFTRDGLMAYFSFWNRTSTEPF